MAGAETLMKVMAGKKVLEGGIEGVNKAFASFSLQARADKIRKKVQAKEEKVQKDKELATQKTANQALLREHGSLTQRLGDMATSYFRIQSNLAETEAHTEDAKKNAEKKAKEPTKKDDEKPDEKEAKADVTKSPEMATGGAIVKVDNEPATVQIVEQDTPVPVQSESMQELLVIEKDLLEIDKRRDAREIKEARRNEEDRRDRKAGLKGGMLAGKGGGPSLNKKDEGGGIMSAIGGFMTSIPGLIAAGGTAATAAIALAIKKWKAPKITLPTGVLDDIARNADEAAKAAKLAGQAALDAKNAALSASKIKATPLTLTDDALKGLAKSNQIINYSDDITRGAASASRQAAMLGTKVDDVALGVGKIAPHVDNALAGGVKATNLINYSDDITRTAASSSRALAGLGTKVDDVASGVKLVQGGVKATNLVNYMDEFGKITTHTTSATSNLARSSQIVNYADDFAGVATKIDGAVKPLAKSVTILDQFGKIPGAIKASPPLLDEFGKIPGLIKGGTEAVQTSLSGGVKATNLAQLAKGNQIVAAVGKIDNVIGTLDNVGPAISGVAGKVDNAVGSLDNVAAQVGKLDEFARVTAKHADDAMKAAAKAAQLAKLAPTLTSPAAATTALSQSDEALKATQAAAKLTGAPNVTAVVSEGIDATSDAARVAALQADNAKLLTAGAKTGGKLMSRFSKMLAPLDIFNKMGQGQGMFEAIGNMGVELAAMVVGGTDYLVEKGQQVTGLGSGEGFMKEGAWGDSSRALEVGDFMGNQKKWQTSYLEMGINSAVAGITGSEKVANAKQYTDEQKAMALAAENETGAVDVGFGQGQIEDLKELTKLNPETLKALLDVHVWKDKDQAMIEAIMKAKMSGQKVEYDDRGLWKSEVVRFGNEGKNAEDYMSGSPTNNLALQETQQAMIERLTKEYGQARTRDDQKVIEDRLMEVKSMTPEEFNAQTPDPELQDTMNAAAVNPGSIFTHDTHLLDFLKGGPGLDKAVLEPSGSLDWMAPTASVGMPVPSETFTDLSWMVPPEVKRFEGKETKTAIDSTMLEQAVVTSTMVQELAKKATGSGSTIVQSIDNSQKSTNVISPASTAHAPFSPAGMGYMGITTPRG